MAWLEIPVAKVTSADNAALLVDAAYLGVAGLVGALLNCSVNVNCRPHAGGGLTPLMAAAMGGHADLVQLLLTRHAKPTLKHASGWTALDFAGVAGRGDVLRVFLDSTTSAAISKPIPRISSEKLDGSGLRRDLVDSALILRVLELHAVSATFFFSHICTKVLSISNIVASCFLCANDNGYRKGHDEK